MSQSTNHLIKPLSSLFYMIPSFPAHLHFITEICDEHWKRFVYACYRLYSSPLSFTDADDVCYNLDAKLVTLKTQAENDFVTRLLTDAAESEAFIGLTYENHTQYMWDGDTPTNYTNWKIGNKVAGLNQ